MEVISYSLLNEIRMTDILCGIISSLIANAIVVLFSPKRRSLFLYSLRNLVVFTTSILLYIVLMTIETYIIWFIGKPIISQIFSVYPEVPLSGIERAVTVVTITVWLVAAIVSFDFVFYSPAKPGRRIIRR